MGVEKEGIVEAVFLGVQASESVRPVVACFFSWEGRGDGGWVGAEFW